MEPKRPFRPLQKLQLDCATRARVTVITALAVLGYIAVVYLIFFLTYTPPDTDHVRGVQGRYFVIVQNTLSRARRKLAKVKLSKSSFPRSCDRECCGKIATPERF